MQISNLDTLAFNDIPQVKMAFALDKNTFITKSNWRQIICGECMKNICVQSVIYVKVWGHFSYTGVSELVFIDRIMNSEDTNLQKICNVKKW